DRQPAKKLQERGHPRRRLGERGADLGEQLREARRPPAELGPPVGHESETDDQSERQRHPLAPEGPGSQLEHLDLLERIASIAPGAFGRMLRASGLGSLAPAYRSERGSDSRAGWVSAAQPTARSESPSVGCAAQPTRPQQANAPRNPAKWRAARLCGD